MSNNSSSDSADNIVPFGRYKGQPVEVMLADRPCCEWALAQPGIRERYANFVTIVVNGGSAPDAPTPEHNRLQLLFRDPKMQIAVYRAVVDKQELDDRTLKQLGDHSSVITAGDTAALTVIDEEIVAGRLTPCKPIRRSGFANRDRDWDRVWVWPCELSRLFPPRQNRASDYEARELGWTNHKVGADAGSDTGATARQAASLRLEEMLKNGEARKFVDDAITEQGVEFEVRGWDVVVRGPDWLSKPLSIELKPQIGDDYPAILRTMKGRVGSNSRALSSSTVSKLKARPRRR